MLVAVVYIDKHGPFKSGRPDGDYASFVGPDAVARAVEAAKRWEDEFNKANPFCPIAKKYRVLVGELTQKAVTESQVKVVTNTKVEYLPIEEDPQYVANRFGHYVPVSGNF